MTNQQYYAFIQPYQDAKQMLLTRLDALNHSLYGNGKTGPIHNIQDRIKGKKSIEEKLKKRGYTDSIQNAKDHLQDIAGIRIICYFVEDISNLVMAVKRQPDLVLIKESNYIANPKPNGYRSHHLVVGVPVYCLDAMEYFPVEIQFRTMSMDFWASMEHRICYKKNPEDKQILAARLKEDANMLAEIEERCEQYNEKSHRDRPR